MRKIVIAASKLKPAGNIVELATKLYKKKPKITGSPNGETVYQFNPITGLGRLAITLEDQDFVKAYVLDTGKPGKRPAPVTFSKIEDVKKWVTNKTVTLNSKAAKKAEENPEDAEYYLLGYWNNAYSRRDDKEYFWMGPFDDRADAVKANKRKQEQGQPKTFVDWVKGEGKVFSSWDKFEKAAKAVGINPKRRE